MYLYTIKLKVLFYLHFYYQKVILFQQHHYFYYSFDLFTFIINLIYQKKIFMIWYVKFFFKNIYKINLNIPLTIIKSRFSIKLWQTILFKYKSLPNIHIHTYEQIQECYLFITTFFYKLFYIKFIIAFFLLFCYDTHKIPSKQFQVANL